MTTPTIRTPSSTRTPGPGLTPSSPTPAVAEILTGFFPATATTSSAALAQEARDYIKAKANISDDILYNEEGRFRLGEAFKTQLYFFSYEDVVKLAVAEIKNDSNGTGNGDVNDLRMSSSPESPCYTCDLMDNNCRGHPGIIYLGRKDENERPWAPIFNTLTMRFVQYIMSLVCETCGTSYYTSEDLKNWGLTRYSLEVRLKKLEERAKSTTHKRVCRKEEVIANFEQRRYDLGLTKLSDDDRQRMDTFSTQAKKLGASTLSREQCEFYERMSQRKFHGLTPDEKIALDGIEKVKWDSGVAISNPADVAWYNQLKTRIIELGLNEMAADEIRNYNMLLVFRGQECAPAALYRATPKEGRMRKSYGKDSKSNIDVLPEQVFCTLDLITNATAEIFGMKPPMHPRNYIIHGLLVSAPKFRRSMAPGKQVNDYMTEQYLKIVKIVNALNKYGIPDERIREVLKPTVIPPEEEECPGKVQMVKAEIEAAEKARAEAKANLRRKAKAKGENEKEIGDLRKKLYAEIYAIYDKSKKNFKKVEAATVKKTLKGKKGLFRGNLQGKKGDYTGRSVISVDSALEFGTAGIPRYQAEQMTRPDEVRDYNYADILRYIANGQVNYIETTEDIPREVDSSKVEGEDEAGGEDEGEKKEKKKRKVRRRINATVRSKYISGRFTLRVGDKIERHLMDGDLVALNRPPTLHKGSIMAFRVVLYDGYTVRLHMYATESFHADFDGDEMMTISPQDIMVVVEMRELMNIKGSLMDPANGKPNVAPVYDTLIAVTKLTRISAPTATDKGDYIVRLTQKQFDDCMKQIIPTTHSASLGEGNGVFMAKLRKYGLVEVKDGETLYKGPAVFSALLPTTLQYKLKNVEIQDGILFKGTLGRANIGFSTVSLVQHFYDNYDVETLSNFLSSIAWVTNYYLSAIDAYSIGLADCLELKMSDVGVRAAIDIIENDIAALGPVPTDSIERRRYDELVAAKMNTLKYIGDKAIKENNMKVHNALVLASDAGAKAKTDTIAQMAGFLGPQSVLGKLMPLSSSIADRPLSILFPGERSLLARTFGTSNFLDGITPEDECIHLPNARVGPVNINDKTSDTGYLQRRMAILMEPYVVAPDRTVRNNYNGVILEYAAGDSNLAPEELMKVKTVKGEELSFFIDPRVVMAELGSMYGI